MDRLMIPHLSLARKSCPQVELAWDLRTVFETQVANVGVKSLRIASAPSAGSSPGGEPPLVMPPPLGRSTAVRVPPSPIPNQPPLFPPIDPAGKGTTPMDMSFSLDPKEKPEGK